MENTERIEKLRLEALSHVHNRDEFHYRFYQNYFKNENPVMRECYGDAVKNAYSELRPLMSDGELIVGKIGKTLTGTEQKDFEENYLFRIRAESEKAGGGQESHMAIDYDLILNVGVCGIIEKIDGYLENCEESKKEFYNTCKKCLEGVIKYSENYSAAAKKLAENERDEERRAELEKISEICKRVPAYPARSFWEAVQSVNFITHCVSLNPLKLHNMQFQLGHPDRYLLPFYEKDIRCGNITKEFAQLLLDCLSIQINNRVPRGLSSGYMVGGRDEKGNIVQNELTEMCMQVIDDVRLVYPAVGLCYTKEMGEKYLQKACELLLKGRSHPAIFNDDVITKGLIGYGVPEKEAHSYIHSTCVEITPAASSNVWVASPYTNVAQLLLDMLEGEYSSFDELLGKTLERFDLIIESNFKKQNELRRIRNDNCMYPLLSCLVNDCLALGKDIEQGGARYNWIMPSFVGMANLVDSLYAIKTVVFDNKEMTLAELKAALDSNFENSEVLRLKLLNAVPKYGNDNDDVDKYFTYIIDHIVQECKKYIPMHQNGRIVPSVFCWIKHEIFGRETGATPDGRLAGFPLGDGSGPCQGREMMGPTASILSSTKWDHSPLIGGVAVNMKFAKSSLGSSSLDTMANLIKTFIARGGFEMQINVVDKETLLAARKNPENYRDLVVRIGGYSDYFVKLSDEMQQEVILRTAHEI